MAQAMAWAFLSHHENGQEPLFDMSAFRGTFSMPKRLSLANGTGLATVYYDNFLILVRTKEEVDRVLRRLQANVKALTIVLKGEILVQTPDELARDGFAAPQHARALDQDGHGNAASEDRQLV